MVLPDAFNDLNEDLVLLPVASQVTSQLNPFPHSIPVSPGDCEEGALPKELMVRLTKVFTCAHGGGF